MEIYQMFLKIMVLSLEIVRLLYQMVKLIILIVWPMVYFLGFNTMLPCLLLINYYNSPNKQVSMLYHNCNNKMPSNKL